MRTFFWAIVNISCEFWRHINLLQCKAKSNAKLWSTSDSSMELVTRNRRVMAKFHMEFRYQHNTRGCLYWDITHTCGPYIDVGANNLNLSNHTLLQIANTQHTGNEVPCIKNSFTCLFRVTSYMELYAKITSESIESTENSNLLMEKLVEAHFG